MMEPFSNAKLTMNRKMGLKGVRGIRYASMEGGGHPGPKRPYAGNNNRPDFSRRMNHQGGLELGINSISQTNIALEQGRSHAPRERGFAGHTRGGRKPHPSAMS